MKKYKYFIAYTANNMAISGSCEFSTETQIKSIIQIREIEEKLIKYHGLKNCHIENFKLF